MANHSSKTRREILGAVLATGVASLAEAQAVRRTPRQVMGPFYPLTKPQDQDADLTIIAGRKGRAQGQVVYVSGRVLTSSGKPIAGASLEIWQANARGRYSHPGDSSPVPLDPDFEGYARLTTDAGGRYGFKTIKPGAYPEGGSGRMRAPHVHVDVSGHDVRLVTQMYFDGEPLNDADRPLAAAGADRERLIVKFAPSPGGREPDSLSGTWDIVLDDA